MNFQLSNLEIAILQCSQRNSIRWLFLEGLLMGTGQMKLLFMILFPNNGVQTINFYFYKTLTSIATSSHVQEMDSHPVYIRTRCIFSEGGTKTTKN